MLMDGFALTEINSGPLAIAANEIATTSKAAAIMNMAARLRNIALEEAIL